MSILNALQGVEFNYRRVSDGSLISISLRKCININVLEVRKLTSGRTWYVSLDSYYLRARYSIR